MGHSHPDGAHTHGGDSNGILDGRAQLVAVVVLGVAAIDVVMWLLHILIIIATAVGFLVLGTGAGYAAVRWRRYKLRRQIRPQSLYLAPTPGQFATYPYGQPARALSPGDGEVHLHLQGADATAVLRAISQSGGEGR
ncbi:MAG TPA: hypothetical protein VEH05_17645 [Streptosporangiaceae bacterium]|nr:hypothetical protein [Streptosporangiaceae bacterium]